MNPGLLSGYKTVPKYGTMRFLTAGGETPIQLKRTERYDDADQQNFLVCLQDSSENGLLTGTGSAVVARIDQRGGIGCVSVHVTPGNNDTAADLTKFGTPTQSIWVQNLVDCYGIVINEYSSATKHSFLVGTSAGSSRFAITSTGSVGSTAPGSAVWYADDGTTSAGLVAAGDTGSFSTRALFKAVNAAVLPLLIRGAASQSVDLVEVQSSASAILSRFNKDGYFMTRKVAAPADADVATSEVALWLQDTANDSYLMVKGKNASGTVVTGKVALGASGPTAEQSIILGKAGTIPAATATDQADFYVTIPYAMRLRRLKAVAKTAPSATTTFQLRRSTNSGTSFSDDSGWTVSLSSVKTGTADPTDLDVSEGDILNFSVTAGNGTGSDVIIEVIGTAR